jgi:hypothetical protein
MSVVRRGRRLSLRGELALVAAAGTMAVLTVGALVLHRDFSGQLSAALTDGLAIRVADLATDYEDGEVTAGAGLVSTQVVDQNGKVISPVGSEPILTADELARASRGQIVVDRSVSVVGNSARLLARPIRNAASGAVVGVAATSTEPLSKARARLAFVLGVAGPDGGRGLVPRRCCPSSCSSHGQRSGEHLDDRDRTPAARARWPGRDR